MLESFNNTTAVFHTIYFQNKTIVDIIRDNIFGSIIIRHAADKVALKMPGCLHFNLHIYIKTDPKRPKPQQANIRGTIHTQT